MAAPDSHSQSQPADGCRHDTRSIQDSAHRHSYQNWPGKGDPIRDFQSKMYPGAAGAAAQAGCVRTTVNLHANALSPAEWLQPQAAACSAAKLPACA